MIVDLATGDRARVTMLRSSTNGPGDTPTIDLKVEEFFPNEHRAQTVTLTVREARKIASYLLWLSEKIEEEG